MHQWSSLSAQIVFTFTFTLENQTATLDAGVNVCVSICRYVDIVQPEGSRIIRIFFAGFFFPFLSLDHCIYEAEEDRNPNQKSNLSPNFFGLTAATQIIVCVLLPSSPRMKSGFVMRSKSYGVKVQHKKEPILSQEDVGKHFHFVRICTNFPMHVLCLLVLLLSSMIYEMFYHRIHT